MFITSISIIFQLVSIFVVISASMVLVSAHFKSENKNLYFVNNLNINWYDLIDSATDIEVYGQVLYSYFVLQLLVTGLILLVVIIGVVYLTNTYNSKQNVD